MNKLEELIQEFCPDGVRHLAIPELFTTRNGYTPSKGNSEFWENGTIPWFRMEDIRANGRILIEATQYVSEKAVKGQLFPENSIIVATSATIGEHALIKVPSLANQRFTYLVLKDEFKSSVDMMFIFYYCFKLDEFCKTHLNQGNFASVDMKQFAEFKFPVPPLPVQREIVRILDNFTELTAELTENLSRELTKRKQQYIYYRESILTFSSNVKWMTIADVCRKIVSGGTPQAGNPNYYGGNIPWLRTQEVDWKDISDTAMKITDEGLKNSSAKWIPANCVIVAMYGATAAKVAINKIPLTTNQACCNLEIDPDIALYRYVFHWLCKEYWTLKGLGQGSQSNINAQTVKQYKIPVPSLLVQQYVVTILDNFASLCADLSSSLPVEIEARQKQYEYYRNKLLSFEEKV